MGAQSFIIFLNNQKKEPYNSLKLCKLYKWVNGWIQWSKRKINKYKTEKLKTAIKTGTT